MAQDIVEMSKDLVMGLIETGRLKPEDMQQQLQNVHATLAQLQAREISEGGGEGPVGGVEAAPVDWKKSIRKHAVTCLICGAVFKQLGAQHLSTHGLDPRSYRQRFGIPSDQPLSAKATTALRREVVRKIRPWEKAPTYGKGQDQEAASAPAAKAASTRKKAPASRA